MVSTLPLMMIILIAMRKNSQKEHIKFLENHGTLVSEDKTSKYYSLNYDALPVNRKLRKRVSDSKISCELVPSIFMVSFVSQYDTFLGRLIRALFYIHPEVLETSEKTLTFSELVAFKSLDDARDYIIESEVDAVLRTSHTEQIKWIEKKWKIPLRNDLPIWKSFIEITERRNLFVHCNGVISNQYIDVCRQNGVEIGNDIKVGKHLNVTSEYYRSTYDVLLEMGVKLGHVMWRKLLPDAMEAADKHLNAIAYDLIQNEKYQLAINILVFATDTLKKHANNESRLIFIINKAQAYKWMGDQQQSKSILSKEDWSATSDQFQLAVAVLQDNYKSAVMIIEKMGIKGPIGKAEYAEWPLFKEFVKTDEFTQVYEKVFGEEFEILTSKKVADQVNDDDKDRDEEIDIMPDTIKKEINQ